MDRTRAAALWGLVGGLSFLALIQGYELAVAGLPVGLGAKLAIAVLVAAAGTAITYVIEGRLPDRPEGDG